MKNINITINGQSVKKAVEPRTSLADFLRNDCLLTGTHIGCEHGVCGACTLLMNGQPIRSCITPAVAAEGSSIQTIEGYKDALFERLKANFKKYHALQCGFCTPGMLATAYDIVQRFPHADRAVIKRELSGNICRCTGYLGIVSAIEATISSVR